MKTKPDNPGINDPATRTRLAWNRTALAFAAIGAAMLKSSPVAGVVVLVLSAPIWVAIRGGDGTSTSRRPRLVTVTVLLVAATALVVAFLGHSPGTRAELLHGR